MLSARPRCRGNAAAGAQAIFGSAGLDLGVPDSSLAAGQACRVRLGDASLSARVFTARLPRTAAFVLPDLDDALLFVERESLKDDFTLGLWLSTYGLPEARTRALQADLDALAKRLAAG
jgi:hypothetical protein